MHAGVHAFNHRRAKKGGFRRLWQIKINAAARKHGLSYSALIGALKKKSVGVDRKILAHLAESEPKTFDRIIEHVK